jgi:plastocyanin
MFTSGEIVKGGHFGHTFGETLGTYEFTDPTHPGMKGTIFVKKGEVISGSPVIVTAASS